MAENKHDKDPHIAAALIEESAEDLYENAPCGYLSTLPNGLIVKINSTLLNWIGYERHEVLYEKKLRDFFSIGGKIFYETHHVPLLKMQGHVNELNYELLQKEGGWLPVLLTGVQLKDAAGVPLLNRITIFNITDRKKYEVELLQAKKKAEEAAKAKAAFLSTVSHEFRTPMNAIIGISNLLQQTELTARQAQFVDVLKFSSENLLNLINDILDFSKIESGKIELEEKQFSIKQLMHSILWGMQFKAEEKGLQLELQLDEQLPAFVYGDPVKLGQVVTNLLANALKFTAQGSVCLQLNVLKLDSNSTRVQVRVKDTGIGISKEEQGKIFEEFTQANPEINLKYGGTGLGLAISQQLLRMFGTTLAVISEPGRGSEFFFNLELPMRQEVEQANPQQFNGNTTASIQGVKLLLAEDNAINIMVVSEYLNQWGVLYDVAADGAEAVALAQENTYDLLLMDLQMPVMDGYEASIAIRAMDGAYYKQLPIIAFTASARLDYKERIITAGINDLLSKPFRPDDLYAIIARWGISSACSATDAEQADKQILAPIAAQNAHSYSPVISLQRFKEITRNKPESLRKLLLLTIDQFQEYKISFAEALFSRDIAKIDDLAHKIKMVIQLLEANRIRDAVAQARSSMPTVDKTQLLQLNDSLLQALDGAIEELRKHLNE